MKLKEKPILFSAPMVRAILDGRKTQTRRVLSPYPPHYLRRDREFRHVTGDIWGSFPKSSNVSLKQDTIRCAFGEVGDQLWVRETFRILGPDMTPIAAYRASCADDSIDYSGKFGTYQIKIEKWTPSIHMPRWASRIDLEITNIRIEQLQDISEGDAKAEGVEIDTGPCDHRYRSCDDVGCFGPTYKSSFLQLWEGLNARRGFSWDTNPWVWVIDFRRTK